VTERKARAFGSGNVFEDLGVAAADGQLAKADLVSKIASVVEARGLTQVEVSRIAGIPRSEISRLLSGKFGDLSLDRLRRMLRDLGAESPTGD
jgi:predicted XRE-type DNA-binding protein